MPSCINDRVRVGTVKWAPTYGDKTDAEIVSPLLLLQTDTSMRRYRLAFVPEVKHVAAFGDY